MSRPAPAHQFRWRPRYRRCRQAVLDAANKAIQDTMEQLRELRRQAASSIVVPDMSKGGHGGLGGGGKIQMP